MKNKDKIILDLCGGSGSWSKPYKDAGYDVRLITLPDFDVTKTYPFNNFVTDSLEHGTCLPNLHFSGEKTMNIPVADIYGILAAPPCTEFSRAKSTAPRDFEAGMKTVRACMEIIWLCQINKRLQFWALENPMGMLRRFLGRPEYTFQPWWFGDFHTKSTDLWGWFKIPTQKVFTRPLLVEHTYHNKNSKFFGCPKCPDEYKHLKLNRAGIRSITPSGFAKAFFKKNQ